MKLEQDAVSLIKKAVEISEDNTEQGHVLADKVLRDFVADLGYKNLVEMYDKVDKWYD